MIIYMNIKKNEVFSLPCYLFAMYAIFCVYRRLKSIKIWYARKRTEEIYKLRKNAQTLNIMSLVIIRA